MLSLRHKSVRLAAAYVLLCGACFALTRWQQLAYCPDWRLPVVRELNEPADVLFLGSSRTVRGVMPLEFEDELRAEGAEELRSINLGVFGTPRHINYLQLVDYLKRHDAPKVVFVEAGSPDIIFWGHQILPRFISFVDAFRIAIKRPYAAPDHTDPFVRRIVSERTRRAEASGVPVTEAPLRVPRNPLYALHRLGFHFELAMEALGRGPEDCARAVYNVLANAYDSARGSEAERASAGEFPNIYRSSDPPINPATTNQQIQDRGWYRIPTDTAEAQNGVQDVQRKAGQISFEESMSTQSNVVLEPGIYGQPMLYTPLLSDLCRERGIRLIFMYLPEFRAPMPSPSQVELYQSSGEYFVGDMERLQQTEHFQDTGHFNVEGAKLFSRMLARYLIENP